MPVNKNMKIDDEALYRVELAERVEVLGEQLVPGQDLLLRGDALKAIIDKVENAEPV